MSGLAGLLLMPFRNAVCDLISSCKEKFSDNYKYEAFKQNAKFKNPITLKKATNVFRNNYQKQRLKK